MRDYKDPGKAKRSAYMTYDTNDALTAAALFFEDLPVGEGHRTMSEIIESAVLREIKRLQDKYNGGKSFEFPDGLPLRRGFVRGAMDKEKEKEKEK